MPATLKEINQYLIEGKTDKALETMRLWAQANAPDQLTEIDLQSSRLNTDKADYLRGTVTLEEHRVTLQRINEALLQLINQIKQTATPPEGAESLHDYHRYTCDRVEQNDTFERVFGQQKVNRAQFYYLYGGDLQSHEGMFRRIAYNLEGRLLDYLNPELTTSCKSLQVELTFDFSQQIDIYKENIVKSLFAAMSIPVNDHEPLLDRNLLYVVERSPKLQGLCEKDFVCIYLHISQYDWDPKLTPVAATWFIKTFCQPELPAESPQFLLFFAIEYDETDEELRKEVEAAIAQSEQVQALPELTMVHLRDIGRWMEKYKKIAPNSRDRKALMDQHFGSGDEHYMEDVELALQQIIDAFNKQYIR